MTKYTLTYDPSVTLAIEVDAESIEQARDLVDKRWGLTPELKVLAPVEGTIVLQENRLPDPHTAEWIENGTVVSEDLN